MAIDSVQKRKSISSIGLPFFAPGVTPDATTPVGWRQTSGWSYYGIAAATVDYIGAILGATGIYNLVTPTTGIHNLETPPTGEYEI